MYILAPNGVIEKYPYSIGELRKDNPQVSFPRKPKDELLAEYGVHPVSRTERPEHDPHTERLAEGTPVLHDGIWSQTFAVMPLPDEETAQILQSHRESARLTPAQFRLQLLAIDELDRVEQAMADPNTPREVQILWEYATEFQRLNSSLLGMAGIMGYTDEQMDALFGIA